MLKEVWFILWGVLWMIYFMLDGFDLGLGTLLPVLAKNEDEKHSIFNSMAPFWDGNEVWLIAAGGVTFAAFPTAYAVLFSSLYSAFMLVLFALILRGVSFEFRDKEDNPRWRGLWDFCLIIGSFLPALLFGVLFANLFKGIPIAASGIYKGTLLTLLNPYGLLGGLLFLAMFMLHGTLWLTNKSEGSLHDRAASLASKLWKGVFIIAVIFLIATAFYTNLYHNYLKIRILSVPILVLIPILAVSALVATRIFISKSQWWKAWFSSCATIGGTTLFGVVGLYPNLLISNLNPAYSLNIHNASSSPLTLKIMLGVVVVFLPLIIVYQAWAYNLFKDILREEDLAYE